MASETVLTVNMKELSAALRVTRQTLFNWVERWNDFPVVSRGSNGREYQFDVAEVKAFLERRKEAEASSAVARNQDLSQFALPLTLEELPVIPGASIKDRIEAAKLRRLLSEEKKHCSHFVESEAFSRLLLDAFSRLKQVLHIAIHQAGDEQNLPEAVVWLMMQRVDAVQDLALREINAALPPRPGRS